MSSRPEKPREMAGTRGEKDTHLMGFYGDLMGFYGDLMGFYGDLMGFYGDLMGFNGILW